MYSFEVFIPSCATEKQSNTSIVLCLVCVFLPVSNHCHCFVFFFGCQVLCINLCVDVGQLSLRHLISMEPLKQRLRTSLTFSLLLSCRASLIRSAQLNCTEKEHSHTHLSSVAVLVRLEPKLTNFSREGHCGKRGRNDEDDTGAVCESCCYWTKLGRCYKQLEFDDACRDSCLLLRHITSHEFMLLSLAGCCGGKKDFHLFCPYKFYLVQNVDHVHSDSHN